MKDAAESANRDELQISWNSFSPNAFKLHYEVCHINVFKSAEVVLATFHTH
jgi:hypothetical protein